jgi:hypothetical protein
MCERGREREKRGEKNRIIVLDKYVARKNTTFPSFSLPISLSQKSIGRYISLSLSLSLSKKV